jgi:alkaline phosphatase
MPLNVPVKPSTRVPSLLLFAACAAAAFGASAAGAPATPEQDYAQARSHVAARAANEPARRDRARNVILFVGDGMSITTITAARILEGQRKGGLGEDNRLSFEDFDYSALVRTYSFNQQTSDSAPTATAMMTGFRANDGALSVSPRIGENEADQKRVSAGALTTLLEQAEERGLSTGVVTTTRITHATPASTYAHTPNRDWEFDAPVAAKGDLLDIAAQLIARQKTGNGIEVVLGGGRQMLLPATQADPEYPAQKGVRRDGRNLIEEWVAAQPGSSFVWNRKDFDAVDAGKTGHLLGLFEPSHMRYETDRAADGAGEPALADMTRKALGVLKSNRKGYFLMVEGGRIDHGHHAGNAYRALTDTIAFSDAVRAAVEATDPRDTLILVTADHSHTLTMAGYPGRGNPILGLARGPDAPDVTRDVQGRPYATLAYANGPGFAVVEDGANGRGNAPVTPGRVRDLSEVNTQDEGYFQEALVGLPGETHGGDDVALYARGPGARVVRGSIDQNEIYHVMRRALGF